MKSFGKERKIVGKGKTRVWEKECWGGDEKEGWKLNDERWENRRIDQNNISFPWLVFDSAVSMTTRSQLCFDGSLSSLSTLSLSLPHSSFHPRFSLKVGTLHKTHPWKERKSCIIFPSIFYFLFSSNFLSHFSSFAFSPFLTFWSFNCKFWENS